MLLHSIPTFAQVRSRCYAAHMTPSPAVSLSTATKILSAASLYAPAVLAGVLGVEQAAAHLPGETKAQIVVATTTAGLQAAGQLLPPGHVQEFAALAQMFVTILNATGIFKRRPPAPEVAIHSI